MICVNMYNGRDKNINSQTTDPIKYISKTDRGMMQNKIYLWQRDNGKSYFRVCVKIFNRWKIM